MSGKKRAEAARASQNRKVKEMMKKRGGKQPACPAAVLCLPTISAFSEGNKGEKTGGKTHHNRNTRTRIINGCEARQSEVKKQTNKNLWHECPFRHSAGDAYQYPAISNHIHLYQSILSLTIISALTVSAQQPPLLTDCSDSCCPPPALLLLMQARNSGPRISTAPYRCLVHAACLPTTDTLVSALLWSLTSACRSLMSFRIELASEFSLSCCAL